MKHSHRRGGGVWAYAALLFAALAATMAFSSVPAQAIAIYFGTPNNAVYCGMGPDSPHRYVDEYVHCFTPDDGFSVSMTRYGQSGAANYGTYKHPRQARGRPPDAWTIAPDARPGGEAPRAYQDLGRWLARAMRSRPAGLRSVEATGRQIGRELALHGPQPGPDALETALVTLGFQPAVTLREGDRLTFCLRNCPYRDAVRENQPVVCTLHKGITRGLLDVLDPNVRLAGFVPHELGEVGCLIELRGLTPAPAAQ
jgi:hypothetical protein